MSVSLYKFINAQMMLNERIARAIKTLHLAGAIKEPHIGEAEAYLKNYGATAIITGIVYITTDCGKQQGRYDLPACILAIHTLMQDMPSRTVIADKLKQVDNFELVNRYVAEATTLITEQIANGVPPEQPLITGECDHDHK